MTVSGIEDAERECRALFADREKFPEAVTFLDGSDVPIIRWVPEGRSFPLGAGQSVHQMLSGTPHAEFGNTKLEEFWSTLSTDITNPGVVGETRIWRSLMVRVNVGMVLLECVIDQLSVIDAQLEQVHDNPDAWMLENWEAHLAGLLYDKGGVFQTAHERMGIVDYMRDIVPVLRDMPQIDETATVHYERMRQFTKAAQAIKRFLAGHLQLITTLMRAGYTTDVQCLPLLLKTPVSEFAEGAMCDENMECTAARLEDVDFLSANPNNKRTLFQWVMAHVRPASVHIADFISRIQDAINRSEEFSFYVFECLTATICGHYPHARQIGSFGSWLDCHWWRLAAPQNQIRALDAHLRAAVEASAQSAESRNESEERLLFSSLRERFVRDCSLAPAMRLNIRCQYESQAQFETSVSLHCDRMRQGMRELPQLTLEGATHQANINSFGVLQTWHTFHQTSANSIEFISLCLSQIDLMVVVNKCIEEGRALPVEYFRPPEIVLRAVNAYIMQNVAPYAQFDRRWLTDLCVSPRAAKFMQLTVEQHRSGSLTSASGQASMRQLFALDRYDYALCSIIFHALAAHRRNRIIRLDESIAVRQCRAIMLRPELATSQSSCHCLVSSLHCCNSLKTLVVQTSGACTGSEPTRQNLTTGEHTCRAGKTGQYTSARNAEKVGGRNTISAAFEAYQRCRKQAQAAPELAFSIENEMRLTEANLRAVLRTHAQSVTKTYLHVSCDDSEIISIPVVGYAFEQHTTQAESISCTVCPLCANKTRYNTKLFGINGFSCGTCQPYIYEEYAELIKPTCAVCELSMELCDKLSKSSGIDKLIRQWPTERTILDDVSVPGMSFSRLLKICSVCNMRWLRDAPEYLSLSEIRHHVNSSTTGLGKDAPSGQNGHRLVNIVGLPHLETYVDELETARDNLAQPLPKIGSVSDIPKIHTIRTGLGRLRFNMTIRSNNKRK